MISHLSKTLVMSTVLALNSISFTQTASAEYQLLDRIIAIVEDDVVLASDIRNQIIDIKNRIVSTGGQMPSDDVLFEQILERSILENLQLQRASQMGMRISDQQLNEAMSNIAARNNLSLADFKTSIEQQGESYLKIREKVRKDLLINEVQRRSVIRNISISESEVDNFLQSEQGQLLLSPEFNIDHILLPLPASPGEQTKALAKEKASQIQKLALKNGGFAAIVNEIAAHNAERSPLGWRRAENMPSLFKGVVDTMAAGDVSAPILSDSGYHVIYINEKRGGVEGKTTETNVRHILIAPNEIRTIDEAKILASEVKAKLNEGEDFVQLARKYSDDPGSALSGGDLGWSEPGVLVPIFEETMNNAEIGISSPIFQSQFGWHILEVIERREKDLSQERAAQRARMAIAETKYDDELNNWLQELRDNAFVDIK
ncbi:MAG: peptidylprolyl isomerase [Pseudomonadales bacterium]|nr:peptidylprolyl isomerase [Pseudomonadales bacterium]